MMRIEPSFVKSLILLSVLTLSACGSSSIRNESETGEVELAPVGNDVGVLSMPVSIHGNTVNLVVATEVPGPTLSSESAVELRLAFDRELTINTAAGTESQMRLTESVPISPAGVDGASVNSPFIVFNRNLAPLGIEGMVPPQLFSGRGCLELSFVDQTASFLRLPCPSDEATTGYIELKTGDLMDGKNRLFFIGTNPYGVEGKIIVATGSEFSTFSRNSEFATGEDEDCERVSSISENKCVSLSSGATITIGDIALKGSRANVVDSLSTEEGVVGVIGADMLQSAVLRLSATQNTLIIQLDDR